MKTVEKDIIQATHPEPLLLTLTREIKQLEKAYLHIKYKRFLEGRMVLYAVIHNLAIAAGDTSFMAGLQLAKDKIREARKEQSNG